MASTQDGCVALMRIDKTIQDPIWEAAKSEKRSKNASNDDPTGQLPNQPHIELLNSQFYIGPRHVQDPG
jgi:hypothetical protein